MLQQVFCTDTKTTANQKDDKITNYLGILWRLGPPTYCQKKKKNTRERAGKTRKKESIDRRVSDSARA